MGRPAGRMTPLRAKAAREMIDRIENGQPILVAAIARKLAIDRRSARRIIADVRALGFVANNCPVTHPQKP